MKRFAPALLALLIFTGCGSSKPELPRPTKLPHGIPQSAARPEGYKPAALPTLLFRSPSSGKHISARGLHLIEGFEGFSSCAYWDFYGRVWTRGYGETEGIGQHSPCISRAYGEANLRYRLQRYYEWSLAQLRVPLNQNQWDALCSFTWNLGAGIFQGSTLGAELRSRLFYAASRQMLAYDHAGGQVLQGLRTRREAEVRLFLTPLAEPACNACKLRPLYARRQRLRHLLAVHRCRVVHGARAYKGCPDLARKGREVNAAIRRLGGH